ncbi:MAG TPA: hypothetical protein VFX60_15995 [Micromonospora sp.]|nr:hypothetical protein [Micromonospora sp.]
MRVLKLAAACLLAVAMMGADGGCQRTNRQPFERQVDPKNKCTAKIEVTEATGPYSIWLTSEDAAGGKEWYERGKKATGAGWWAETSYTCGEWHLKVEFQINGNEKDVFGCKITDDAKYPGNEVEQLGFGSVKCELTIGRAGGR